MSNNLCFFSTCFLIEKKFICSIFYKKIEIDQIKHANQFFLSGAMLKCKQKKKWVNFSSSWREKQSKVQTLTNEKNTGQFSILVLVSFKK